MELLIITIRDEQGKLIEKCEAGPMPGNPDIWEFCPKARVPCGTVVIVQVAAMDCMMGIGMRRERKQIRPVSTTERD